MIISNAYAQASPAPAGGGFIEFLPLIVLVAIFYFMILRPQQKRAKEQKAMLSALQKGDEIVTQGGVLGRVVKVGDSHVSMEIADNVTVLVQKHAIQNVLPKGTIKAI